MQVIECWNIQEWDGGERHNHAFYLTDMAEKDKYLKAHKHNIATKQTLVFFDTLQEVEDNEYKKVKDRALAKLTPHERKVLKLG